MPPSPGRPEGRTPTVTQLRAFLAVVEHGHFRDAASAVGVSQPGLSAAVAALEAGLGVRLLERSTRRVLVTPVGERVAAHARDVIEAMGALQRVAAAGPLRSGPLRIGMIPTVAPYLLPVLLPATRRGLPGLGLHVNEEQTQDLVHGLVGGRLDLAVLALPVARSDLVEIPLYVEELALAVPRGHRLSGRSGLDRAVLREVEVLVLDEGHCLRDQALGICREVGVRAAGTTHLASLATALRLVAGGLGATFVPETALAVDAVGVEVGVARFAVPPSRVVGLVHRATSVQAEIYQQVTDLWRGAVGDMSTTMAEPAAVDSLTGTSRRTDTHPPRVGSTGAPGR